MWTLNIRLRYLTHMLSLVTILSMMAKSLLFDLFKASRAVTNRIFLSDKTYFPTCKRNMLWELPSNTSTMSAITNVDGIFEISIFSCLNKGIPRQNYFLIKKENLNYNDNFWSIRVTKMCRYIKLVFSFPVSSPRYTFKIAFILSFSEGFGACSM